MKKIALCILLTVVFSLAMTATVLATDYTDPGSIHFASDIFKANK